MMPVISAVSTITKTVITKTIFSAMVLILLAVPVVTVQGSSYENRPPDIQRIKDRGKLVVAMFHQDIPPFFMHDDQGRFYGLDVDLARDIADSLGVEVEFNREAESFNEIVRIVAAKEADLAISWLSRTLERAETVRFTRPYIVLHHGLLINRLRLSELSNRQNPMQALNHPDARVGVRAGTSYVEYAHAIFPQAQIQEFPDWEPYIVEAVFRGELVAGYHDEIEIKKYTMQRPEVSIQASTAIIKDLKDPIAMAVPWDSHALLDWLNLYIREHARDWNADKVLQEYEGSLEVEK